MLSTYTWSFIYSMFMSKMRQHKIAKTHRNNTRAGITSMSTAGIWCPNKCLKISEVIDNNRLLLGFVSYFSRFWSFWPIFDRFSLRKFWSFLASYIFTQRCVLQNLNYILNCIKFLITYSYFDISETFYGI